MKRILRSTLFTAFLAVTVAVGMVPKAALAQATINQTTLSAAVSASTNTIVLASAATVVAGQLVYIDREALLIQAVSSTTLTVQRGVNGTLAARHASGAAVFTGPQNYFYGNDVTGPCTATTEVALPHINVASGNIFDCKESFWARFTDAGNPIGGPENLVGGPATKVYTVTATAITIAPGVQFIGSSGALALTLGAPTTAQNGMIMVIVASTAQAHTVTNTAGFNGGTTARDVATFGGAIGDNIVIVAVNGVWWVISSRNVTFG